MKSNLSKALHFANSKGSNANTKEFSGNEELIGLIKNKINSEGFVVTENFIKNPVSIENTKKTYLSLCNKIGVPIPHDAQGKIIWDIKSKPKDDTNGVITYSEHNHEADLHTDSQYSDYPEDYFALLTLKKASCGGGMSYILTLKDILEELNESEEGKEKLDILYNTKYPFIVPNVFKKHTSSEPEFVFGHILSENEIRFRVDTIQKAIDFNPDFCSKKQISAFNFLVNLVRNTKRTNKFFLENNDLIVINNKTTLHGRSSFNDDERHLLRIRMNKFSA